MNLSRHALERWVSRFPTLKLYDEWSRACQKSLSKRQLNTLRKQTTIVKGHKYRISPAGVVFVTDGTTGKIITVIPLEENS